MFEAWFRSIVVGGTGKEGETDCHHRRYCGDEKNEEDEKGKLWVAVWYLRFSPASCEECGMMRLHSNTLFTILFSCLTASYLPQTGSPYPTLVFSWLLHQAEGERKNRWTNPEPEVTDSRLRSRSPATTSSNITNMPTMYRALGNTIRRPNRHRYCHDPPL